MAELGYWRRRLGIHKIDCRAVVASAIKSNSFHQLRRRSVFGQPRDPIRSLGQNWQECLDDLFTQSACYGARPVIAG